MTTTFERIPGFCPDCGSILPPLTDKGGVTCYTCSRKFVGDLSEGKNSICLKLLIFSVLTL